MLVRLDFPIIFLIDYIVHSVTPLRFSQSAFRLSWEEVIADVSEYALWILAGLSDMQT